MLRVAFGGCRPPVPSPSAGPVTVTPERLGVLGLLRVRGYRRLLGLRFATQWGDGMFQAALGGAVLFNPERQADPLAVAAGLAVLLMPYSRGRARSSARCWTAGTGAACWSSPTPLRVGLVAVVAAAVVRRAWPDPALYLGALAVMGFSRFVLAGLSVALPHVVRAAQSRRGQHARGDGRRWRIGAGRGQRDRPADAGRVGQQRLRGHHARRRHRAAARRAARHRVRRRSLGPDVTVGPSGTVVRGAARLRRRGAARSAANPVDRRVVRGPGRAPARVRHQHPADAAALPLLVHRRRAAARRVCRGSGRPSRSPRPGCCAPRVVTPWLVRRWGRPWTIRVALAVAA